MAITKIAMPVDALEAFSLQSLRAMGMSEEEARLCTIGLMDAELHYHPGQGQGIGRLTGYYKRIKDGAYNLGVPFEIVKESPALALVDGHNGLGSVIGQKAMKLAVDKAKISGVGTVIVRNSTHFGSSAVHSRVAVAHDCIGIAMTNAGPEMAPWGAASGVVGTNPWGISAPTGGDFPVSLDIALTTAGKGMMRWHEREGKKMPLDWAMTPEGEETDDPTAAMTGALLGIGQYKGYGLAFMTDMLTGVIAGGGYGVVPYSNPLKLDVSHTFIALDIAWFMPVAEFKARMDDFINMAKSAKKRPGVEEILVPGEVEYRREQGYRKNGALVDEEVFNRLAELATTLGIAFPFERTVVSA